MRAFRSLGHTSRYISRSPPARSSRNEKSFCSVISDATVGRPVERIQPSSFFLRPAGSSPLRGINIPGKRDIITREIIRAAERNAGKPRRSRGGGELVAHLALLSILPTNLITIRVSQRRPHSHGIFASRVAWCKSARQCAKLRNATDFTRSLPEGIPGLDAETTDSSCVLISFSGLLHFSLFTSWLGVARERKTDISRYRNTLLARLDDTPIRREIPSLEMSMFSDWMKR